jgi:predicted nuclease with TOPRIM domain
VKKCELPALKADEIDRVVWTWVVQKLQDFDTIRSTIAKDIEDTQKTNEAIYQRVGILDSRIAETQKQIQRMLDLYTNSNIDQKYLDEMVEKLQNTVKELNAEQVELLESINKVPSEEQLKEIGELAGMVRAAADIDLKTRRTVLQIVKLKATANVEEGRRTLLITSSMGGEKFFCR